MRYGLGLANTGAYGDLRAMAELASVAEASGWDGIFLEDYIFHWAGKETYDPWIILAAMAMRTEHIRLGITVTPLSRRRPWKVAREAVTLDHLSHGRVIVGVGLGNGADPDFAGMGEVTDAKQRAAIVDESLDIIAGLWSGQPFSYEGEHFHIREVTFSPKPVQQPRIPIWVGGGWPLPGPTQRALRWDGSCMYKHPVGQWQDWTPEDVQTLRAQAEAERTTSTPFDIVVGGRARGPNLDKERAYARSLAGAGATWYGEFIEPGTDLETAYARVKGGPLRTN